MFHTSFSKIPKYRFQEFWENSCALSFINLTAANKNFGLILHRPQYLIQDFHFISSKLEVLTDDVCEALPFIRNFEACGLGLTSIETKAFKKCFKLSVINLKWNSLKILPLGLFSSNVDLTKVMLHSNALTEIDENLFKVNINLQELDLQYNKLTKFSLGSEVPVMEKLTKVNLRNKTLGDFNVRKLLQKCPNLKEVNIENNNVALVTENYIKNIENQTQAIFERFQSNSMTTQQQKEIEDTVSTCNM